MIMGNNLTVPAGGSYLYFFYENYVRQGNPVANLKNIRDNLLIQQKAELARRELAVFGGASKLTAEQLRDIDDFFNKTSDELTKTFFPQGIQQTKRQIPQVTVEGEIFNLSQITAIRNKLNEANDIVSAAANFGAEINTVLTNINSRFRKPEFRTAVRDAILKKLAAEKQISEGSSTITKKIMQDIVLGKKSFISAKLETAEGNVDRYLAQLFALVEGIRDPSWSKTALSKPRGWGSSSGKSRSMLETMVSKANGWEQQYNAELHEVAAARGALLAKIKIGQALLAVKGKVTPSSVLTGKRSAKIFDSPELVKDLQEAEILSRNQTISKEDMSITYTGENLIGIFGFTVKGSRKGIPKTGITTVKAQEDTPVSRILVHAGLYNPAFISEFIATASGHPSRSNVLKNYMPKADYTEADLTARWKEMLDILKVGVTLQAISGYGVSSNDAATLFVYNNRVISIRELFNAMVDLTAKTRLQLTGIEQRKTFTAMNPVFGQHTVSWRYAKKRSEKHFGEIREALLNAQVKMDLILDLKNLNLM